MNIRDTLKNAREFIRRQGGAIAPLPITEEELDPSAQDDQSFQAYALEPTTSCQNVDYTYPDDYGITIANDSTNKCWIPVGLGHPLVRTVRLRYHILNLLNSW